MTKKYRILVAENDEFINDLFATECKAHLNCEVTQVIQGSQVLSKIKEIKPDVVLQDIMMNEYDGLEIMRQAKKDPALKKVRFIILTALPDPAKAAEAKDGGALAYFTKTSDRPAELIKKIGELLKQSKSIFYSTLQ